MNDKLQTILKYLKIVSGWIFLVSSMWLASTILFSTNCQRPALWTFFVSYVIDYILNLRWKTWKWTLDKWLYVAWIIYFLLIPLYHWIVDNEISFIYSHLFNYSLPFLGVGVMGILGFGKQFKLPYVAYAFIITSIATVGYIILHIPYEWVHSPADFVALISHVRTTQVAPHMMFNLYLNTSLIMGLYILRHKTINKYIKIATAPLVLVILAILLVSDGRVGFTSANVIIVFFLLVEIWERWRKTFIPSIIVVALAFICVLMLHPRIENAPNDTRQYIWNVSIKTICEHPTLGKGISASRSQFIQNGTNDEHFVYFYRDRLMAETNGDINPNMMHPHNALLDAWMCFGILGLLLMIFILAFPFILFAKQRNAYGIAFAFTFAMQAMFETWGTDMMPLLYTLGILWIYTSMPNYKK